MRDLGMVAGMLPGVMSPMKGLGLPEYERPWDEFSGDIDTLVNRKDLPESLPRQILFDNPRRFYKLKVDG